jgi:predicted amidohydrolase YtcJ
MAANMEKDLQGVIRFLVEQRWPFRLHATYNETIERALDAFEAVHRNTPFNGLRWFFDHAETASEKSLERIKKLGGGVAVQHRMAFQGEYFIDRYGKHAAEQSPPIRKMLEMGVPVGGGTDATRVASYNPFVSLYWLTTGKTVGGTAMYNEQNLLTREEALRVWTQGSAYKSNEETVKGTLGVGQYADLAVLSHDYMSIADEAIKDLTSVLTVVGGKIVYAADDYAEHDAPLTPVSPDWSPVARFGGYSCTSVSHHAVACRIHKHPSHSHDGKISCWLGLDQQKLLPSFENPWALGCGCFAY